MNRRLVNLVLFAFIASAIVSKFAIPQFTVSVGRGIALGLFSVLALCLFYFSFLANTDNRQPNQFASPLSEIKITVLCLIAAGFLSSIVRVNLLPNLAFWAAWAANLFVIWWIVPQLTRRLNAYVIVNTTLWVIFITLLLSVIFTGYYQGRMGGVFSNATTLARISVIAYIIGLACFASGRKLTRLHFLLLGISPVLLVFAATRASIAAAVLVTALVLWMSLFSSRKRSAFERTATLLIVSLNIGIGAAVLLVDEQTIAQIRLQLRLDSSYSEIYASARALNWNTAIKEFPDHGFLGQGFLSKFGVYDEAKMTGFQLPAYDWTSSHDPLNMVFSFAKQIGWLGMACFLVLLWQLFYAVSRVSDLYLRYILIGLMVAGMVWGLLDGNWLTTFGDPVDRISFVLIATCISHASIKAKNGAQPSRRWIKNASKDYRFN